MNFNFGIILKTNFIFMGVCVGLFSGWRKERQAEMNILVLQIDKQAREVVSRYRRCEIELIEILQQADSARVCYALGFNSLFKYCVDGLGLSEEVAYVFINVARKAKEIPALEEEIRTGKLTVSKARRIVPVLRLENQQQWLDLAKTVSKKELEKQVAAASPTLAVQEQAKYVQEDRIKIQLGVSENLMKMIERVQDIVSQKSRKVATIEDAVQAMAELFIKREDPLEKAERWHRRNASSRATGSVAAN